MLKSEKEDILNKMKSCHLRYQEKVAAIQKDYWGWYTPYIRTLFDKDYEPLIGEIIIGYSYLTDGGIDQSSLVKGKLIDVDTHRIHVRTGAKSDIFTIAQDDGEEFEVNTLVMLNGMPVSDYLDQFTQDDEELDIA